MEYRASEEGSGRMVEGYAALYEQTTNELFGFSEVIERGAFDNADLSDVRALFNHDPNQILARTASGTLKIWTDERGLKFSFEMPETTLGNDLLVMMKRGDISQSSFAFDKVEDEWEKRQDGRPLRRIRSIGLLYDVAPVTYPVYTQTTATARSLDKIKEDGKAVFDHHLEIDLT